MALLNAARAPASGRRDTGVRICRQCPDYAKWLKGLSLRRGMQHPLGDAEMDQIHVFGGEWQVMPRDIPQVPAIPMSFHDASCGMPVRPLEHVSYFMRQYVRQNRRGEPLAAFREHSVQQHVDAGPGYRERRRE